MEDITLTDSSDLASLPTITEEEAIGVLSDKPGTVMFGHSVIFNEDSVKCSLCDVEKDVPEMLSMTKGYREALFRVYLAASFKEVDCDFESEIGGETFKQGPKTTTDSDFVTGPNDLYTSSSGTYTKSGAKSGSRKATVEDSELIEGKVYNINGVEAAFAGGKNWVVHKSNKNNFRAGDALTTTELTKGSQPDHIRRRLTPSVALAVEERRAQKQAVKDHSIGDMGLDDPYRDGSVDTDVGSSAHTTVTDINVDTSSDDGSDLAGKSESVKERFARVARDSHLTR